MNSTETHTLLIVDDHEVIAYGLEHIIEMAFPAFFQIDKANTGREALMNIEEKKYDIYILDLELPDATGFELIEKIRERYADARIIIHTMHDELWYHRKLVSYNVNAIVLKSADSSQIVQAIHAVSEGKTHFAYEIENLRKHKTDSVFRLGQDLSERELSVLKYIAQGWNTSEIAKELCISVNTVETHRRHLNEKLEARNTASLIMNAVKCGLLTSVIDN